MSDLTPNGPSEQVRRTLADTADEIIVETTSPTAVLAAATSRQRRRRGAIAGTSVLALVTIGGIAATRDSGGDSIQSATPSTEAPADTLAVATGGGEPADIEGGATAPVAPAITTPPLLTSSDSESAGGSYTSVAGSSIAYDQAYGPSVLHPWNDGFLTVEQRSEPQVLPTLPDEIVALFPEEVAAAFQEGGRPATIDEAMEKLERLGYLDEVTEILDANPAALEAVYSEPPPMTMTARFTVDGIDWAETVLEPPIDGFPQITVDANRLIVWTAVPAPGGEELDAPLTIASTTDLVNWSLTTVELPAIPQTNELVNTETYVGSFVAVGERWVAYVERHQWVDEYALLPEEVQNELQNSNEEFGWGMEHSDDGLSIEVCSETSCDEKYFFTWAELGLDGPPNRNDGGPRPILLTGGFDGGSQQLPAPNGAEWGQLQTAGNRFVFSGGDSLLQSFDAVNWTPVADLGADQWVNSVVEVDGGLLVLVDGQGGQAGILVSADGTTTDVALPELPHRYHLWNQTGSAAWVVELVDETMYEDGPYSDLTPVTISLPVGDYTFELTDGGRGTTYRLIDTASGELVATQTLDETFIEDELLVTDPDTDELVFVIIEPGTETELARVPVSQIRDAFEAAYDSQPDVAPAPPVTIEPAPWEPDVWLLATNDGVNWLTLDLPDPDFSAEGDFNYFPQLAAINGSTVLYSTVDGWATIQLP